MWYNLQRTPQKIDRRAQSPRRYERNDEGGGFVKITNGKPGKCGHVYERVWLVGC